MRGSPGFVEGELRFDFWKTLRAFLPFFTGAIIASWLISSMKLGRQTLVASGTDILWLSAIVFLGYSICFVLIGVLIALFPVGVGTLGMRSYDGLGIYREIRWEEMRRIRVISIFGIPFIFCLRKSWLDSICFMPTFARKSEAAHIFGQEVPAGHPLIPALMKYGLYDPVPETR